MDESEMDFGWMWSGAGMDEDAGRGERKSRMHGVGESRKTNPIKGIIEVNLPRNEFMKEGKRKRKPRAQEVDSVMLRVDFKEVSRIVDKELM